MSQPINVEAFYSSLTQYSSEQISSQQAEPCSHELEIYTGLDRKGFVCAARILSLGLFRKVNYYNPCQMNDDGQCPIDQYQEFSLKET